MVPRHASRRGVLIAWFRPSGCRGDCGPKSNDNEFDRLPESAGGFLELGTSELRRLREGRCSCENEWPPPDRLGGSPQCEFCCEFLATFARSSATDLRHRCAERLVRSELRSSSGTRQHRACPRCGGCGPRGEPAIRECVCRRQVIGRRTRPPATSRRAATDGTGPGAAAP